MDNHGIITSAINEINSMKKHLNRWLLLLIRKVKTAPLFIVVGVLLVASVASAALVHADNFTNQIANLNEQNQQKESAIGSLQSKAANYQDEIKNLQSQIASIQHNIKLNQDKQVQLQTQIDTDQAKINQQKKVLGEDLKAMYVGGQMSTVEMLATSKDLSDFVDAETYDSAVQGKIQSELNEITQLQNELEYQQNQVKQLLQTQQTQEAQLSSAQQQQTQLLAMNQQQQTQYNQQIQANNNKISRLQQEEIAANQSGVEQTLGGGAPCGGSATFGGVTFTNSYPASLCSAPQDSVVDPWGMLNRECTSYAAWMEFSTGHYVPYGMGNATDWPSRVPSSWVSSTPQVGDVAIRPAVPGLSIGGESDVGHAMYVLGVIDSNTILVGEYNEDFNGEWSIQVRSTDALYNGNNDNLVFIHFPTN